MPLIDSGQVRYIFREFPRDQLDMKAAALARSLQPDTPNQFDPEKSHPINLHPPSTSTSSMNY